ncbi:MAG: LPS export ABC transporter periplasmic protein LptC [Burkholderiales bacterium]|nr:LPS export ABC transporter periplasmic protein LptC [Burkholderiales bacterium]
MDRFTTAFPLLLVSVLAALTFWLERLVQAPAPPRDGSTRHDPDYIVEDFVAVRMGPDGLRLHQLEAHRMLHYPDDDSTHLEAPRLIKYENEKVALTITAKRARVSSEGKTVDFYDDVKAVRAPTPTQDEMVLTTDHLHVVPDDDYARTASPVTIVEANSKVTAVGLELDSEAKVVKLLSNVRGTYVKKK